MTGYLIQRLLLIIPTFIGITLIGFLVMRLAPGDPAELRAAGVWGSGGRWYSVEKARRRGAAQWRAHSASTSRSIPTVWLKSFHAELGESFRLVSPSEYNRRRLP